MQLFNFEWAVASDYALEELPSASGQLTGQGGSNQWIVRRGEPATYTPADKAPALHRVFVEQVRDADSALAFVKQYGFLGTDEDRELVAEILRHRDNLRSVLTWIDHNTSYDESKPGFEQIRRSLTRDNKLVLGNLFNDLVTPQLTVRIDASNPKRQTLQIVPRSLISWMWLRVADEIIGDAEWRVCPICGARFSVDRDARRRRRQYCEKASCRKAAERQRKADERAAAEKRQKRKATKKGRKS